MHSEVEVLQERHQKLRELLNGVEETIETCNRSKDATLDQLRSAFESMVARLETQLKTKLLALLGQKSSMMEELELLEGVMEEVNHQLTSSSQAAFIKKTPHLVGMLQELHDKPTEGFSQSSVDCSFANEVVPDYASAAFSIKGFTREQEASEGSADLLFSFRSARFLPAMSLPPSHSLVLSSPLRQRPQVAPEGVPQRQRQRSWLVPQRVPGAAGRRDGALQVRVQDRNGGFLFVARSLSSQHCSECPW